MLKKGLISFFSILLLVNQNTFSQKLKSKVCQSTTSLGPCYNGKSKKHFQIKADSLDLTLANLQWSIFAHLDIKNFKMVETDLKLATISSLKSPFLRWEKVDARGARLMYVNVDNFSIFNSDFRGSRITWSHFENGDFKQTDFTDAYIANSVFKNCLLPPDFFKKAIIINTKFVNCSTFKE